MKHYRSGLLNTDHIDRVRIDKFIGGLDLQGGQGILNPLAQQRLANMQ